MDALRLGGRLLSRGMRNGKGALTFIGAVLVARGVLRWLEPEKGELLYSQTLRPGEEVTVRLAEVEGETP